MELTVEAKEGVHVVRASGEFDLANAPKARAVFDKLVGEKATPILLNFEKVGYIDSSGLATVIDVFQRSRKYQGKLALCGLSDVVKNVFEIARLDSVFAIHADEPEALGKLKS